MGTGGAVDRFQEMQVFLAVAQEQGFSAAARRLNLSAPSVTRAVAALEQRIGAQLLIRTTRSVYLTEPGQRYFEDCRRILAELEEAEACAADSHAQPSGQLTMTAPVLFGELYVTPVMVRYLEQYPAVSINALLVDRVVRMVEDGIDVAVRIGELADSGHHAVRVGQVRRVVCASPGYLARHGRPRHPDELRQARIIMTSGASPIRSWQFVEGDKLLNVRLEPRMAVTANQAAIDRKSVVYQAAIRAACLGAGLTRVLSYQVADPLASGALEVVLEDFELPPRRSSDLLRENLVLRG